MTPAELDTDVADVIVWTADKLGMQVADFGECTAIGFRRNGKRVLGCIYHGYDEATGVITISAALDGPPPSQREMWILYGYPFLQLGVLAVEAYIDVSNKRSQRLARKLGFKRRSREEIGERDVYRYEMTMVDVPRDIILKAAA